MRWCLLVLLGLVLGVAGGAAVDRLSLVVAPANVTAPPGDSR